MKRRADDTKIILSSILMFSIGFEMGGFQAVLRELSAYFALGKISMGVLVSVQYISVIVMPAIFGRIADQYGKKRVLLVFMLLFSLGSFLVGTSSWLPLTIMSFFLIGAGYGVAESVCTAMLSDQFGQEADRYMNLSQAFLCVGAVIAPVFTSFMYPSWRWTFIASGMLCLISVIMLLFESDFTYVASSFSSKLFDGSIFRSRVFLFLFFAMIVYVGLENGFGYFTETHFHEAYVSTWGPYALSLYWGFMALSRIWSSFSSKNIYEQLMQRFVIIALVFVALYFSNQPVFSLFLCAAIGFLFGPVWSFIMSAAASLSPGKSATVIGMISSGCGVGGAIYPIIMGIIVKYTPLGSGFLFLAVSSMFAWLFVWIASRSLQTL